MTINPILFNAILSMDSYNRGYDAFIKFGNGAGNNSADGTDIRIGTATIVTNSGIFRNGTDRLDDNISFYALAYAVDTNGETGSDETIISYRGTDRMGQDAANGWLTGGGYATPQSNMALDFYNSIVDAKYGTSVHGNEPNISISLTGHSLGGGLGGYVGALYDQDATVFDSMAFQTAAKESNSVGVRYRLAGNEVESIVLIEDLQGFIVGKDVVNIHVLDPAVSTKIYGSTDYSDMWPINFDGIEGYFIEGELLDNLLPFRDIAGIAAQAHPRDLGSNVILPNSLTDLGINLHSMSTLVIRLFAEFGDMDHSYITYWDDAAKYFWPLLYDGEFSRDIGMGQIQGRSLDQALGQNGETQNTAAYADNLRGIIAYSAIEHEVDPNDSTHIISQSIFGDTGIRAFYDDANDLGKAITNAGADSAITSYATDISKAFVQFAGQLALSKIIQGDVFVTNDLIVKAIDGVLQYDPTAGDKTLTINFSDELWTAAGKGTLPNMVARYDLVNLIYEKGIQSIVSHSFANATIDEMWGGNKYANSYDYFKNIIFAVGNGGSYDLSKTLSTPDYASLFVGSAGDDVINGAAGNHLISGEAGNDTLDYSTHDTALTLKFQDYGTATITGGAGNTALKDFALGVENYILTDLGDTVKFSTAAQVLGVSINAGAGRNQMDFSGFDTSVDITTGTTSTTQNVSFQGFSQFVGSAYSDTFRDNGSSEQVYEGGNGLDTLDYSNANAPIIVNTFDGVFKGVQTLELGYAGWFFDHSSGIEQFVGTNGDDYFYANAEGTQGSYYEGKGNSSFLDNTGAIFNGRDIVDFSGYAVASNEAGILITLTGSGNGIGEDGLGGTFGLVGIEQIIGTDGVDVLIGDSSSNWLIGGGGSDTLEGHAGDDHLVGSMTENMLDGGSGNDTYYFTFEQGNTFSANITDLSGTNDKIYLMQDFEIGRLDTFTPYTGIEYLEVSDGTLFEMAGLGLEFTQDLIPSNITGDTIYGDLNNNTLVGTINNDYISGNDGDDIINGGAGEDLLNGDAGNDEIDGGADDDWIGGGEGDDILSGNAGNDKLEGGAGSDDLNGGDGDDALYANAKNINTTDQDFDGLNGGAGNDHLYGSGGGDILSGGEGFDYLYGKDDDALFGDEGQDMLLSTGDNAYLDGGDGNDYLAGYGDNTTFVASAGDDVIVAAGTNSRLLIENETLQSLQFGLASNGSYIITKSDGGHIILPEAIDYISFSAADPGIAFSTILQQEFFTYRSSLVQDTSQQNVGAAYSYLAQEYLGGDEDNVYDCYADGDQVFSGGGSNFYIFNMAYDPGNKTTIYSTIDAEQDIIRLDGISSLDDVQLVFDFGIGSLHFGHSEVVILNALDNGASEHYLIGLDSTDPNAEPGDIALYTLSQVNHFIKNSSGGDLNGYSADDEIYAFALGGNTYGYSGNDTIHGSIVHDVIYGGTGNDTLYGDEGSDQIYGENGHDTIYGGKGNDELYGGDGNDTVSGGYGNDFISGGTGNDTLSGDAGDDEIDGGAGSDTLIDGKGNDTYHARSNDTLIVGEGDNTVIAEETNLSAFVIDLSAYDSTSPEQFTRDFSGNSVSDYKISYGENTLTLLGYNHLTAAPSVLLSSGQILLSDLSVTGYGSDHADTYNEQGFISQNDRVHAKGGDDNFTFMNGDDVFYGGDGNDNASKVFGFSFIINGVEYGMPSGTGSLTAYGEGGDDFLQGGIGDDTLDGGAGNDYIYDLYGGIDTLSGGSGNDFFALDANGGDTIDGGSGTDTIYLADANTLATVYGTPTSSFEIDLVQGTVTASQGGIHQITNIENVIGSELGDTIIGDNNDNQFIGYGGDDWLEGGDGSDTYLFGDPNFSQSEGDDIIYDIGGVADSILFDTSALLGDFSFSTSGSDLVINYTNGTVTVANYSLSNVYKVENIAFTDKTSLRLEDWTSLSFGTEAADTLYADTVYKILYSGAGNDELFADLVGSSLYAGIGDDILNGNIGNDLLSGGFGNDTIYGGAGDDIYLFSAGDGFDTITDTSGFDVLSILGAINLSDLVMSRIGDDLQIHIASGVTITDFYSGNSNNWLEEIQFSDGSTFDLTSLLNPTAQADIFTADQDTIITGNLLVDNGYGVDSDPDDGVLSVIAGTFATANGSVTIAANGDFTYTPNAGYHGTDTFSYTLEDGQGGSDTGFANVTLNPLVVPNTAPVAIDDSFSGNQDADIIGNVLSDNGFGVDSDADGGTLSVVAGTFTTANGSVVILTNGDFTYTPTTGYTGTDAFSYTLEDGQGGSDTGSVSITLNEVSPTNTPPNAVNDSFTGSEDATISGNVLADNGSGADSDADLDTLSVTAGTFATAHGSVTLAANGDFTYTPTTNYNGADSFTYTVTDGNGGSDTGTASLSLTAVNDAPVAGDDSNSGNEDTVIVGSVLGNDSDVDGDTLSVVAETYATAHGSVTIAANGSYSYTPNADYNGADSFDYTLSDGQGGNDTGTVTLSITSVNDAPIAVNDSFSGNPDVNISGTVLSNDSDVDGDTLGVIAGTYATAHGSVNIATDGSFLYSPLSGYFGSDSFEYTVQDGNGGSDIGSVNLTINEVSVPNTAPVAADDTFAGSEDATVTGNVLVDNGNGADTDADLDTLSVTAGTFATSHGSVVISTNGDFTYTPTANYNGADSFTYIVTDGNGGSDTGIVSLSLTAVNDAPIAADDVFSGNQDALIVGNLLANNGNGTDSDIDGNALSVTAGTFASVHGSVTIASNGNFTYTPNAGYTGADSFTYTVQDGNGGSDTGAVNLTLNAVSSGDIYGTSGNDNITGTAGDDVIHGLFGYDFISGEAGNDILYGDEDGDTLKGRDGDDILYGGDGIDYLEGNNGNDILYGGLGIDSLKGSAGVDTFVYLSSSEGGDVIFDFNPGAGEKIDLAAVLENAVGFIDTNAFTDGYLSTVQNGADVELYLDIDGSAGSGSADLFITLQGLNVSNITLSSFILPTTGSSTNYAPIAADDAFTGFQDFTISGNLLHDNGNGVDSDANGDILNLTAETIATAHGSVVISSNGDFLYSPDTGYVGADSFSYNVFDGNGGNDTGLVSLSLTPTNVITGTSANDTITGTSADDVIYGGAGNDFLSGELGNDVLFGGDGDDTLKGRDGDDILYGGAGNDYLEGNGGHDFLYGGDGIDILKGGANVDSFVFQSMSEIGDTIIDFRPNDGDSINIADLLTGYDPLTDLVADFVQITDNGTDSYLAVDVDGGANNFVQVATIVNYIGLTDVDALHTSGNLITA